MRRLIWWHNAADAVSIWSEFGGPNIEEDASKLRVRVCSIREHLSHATREELEEEARRSCLRWVFLEDELWNTNYDHKKLFHEPLPLYESRMRRFRANIVWGQTIRDALS